MSTTVQDIINYVDSIAPFKLQESYDNARLITGSPSWEVSGVLCSLDAVEAVIDEALTTGCNLVLAHHPIVFSGLKSITGATYIERTMIKAIKHDIAILAVHTNLDSVHPGGVNSRFADLLGLSECEVLLPKPYEGEAKITAGIGLVGNLPAPMDQDLFLDHVKSCMNLKLIKHTPWLGEGILRVAVCGGSGSFVLPQAIAAGAHVLITADYKYHQFFDANEEIIILDIGHYESERHTIELLHEMITENFSTFAAHCTKVDTNPVEYYL